MIEGIGGKARIYRLFGKFKISRFFAISEYNATIPQPEKSFFGLKMVKTGHSLIGMRVEFFLNSQNY